MNIRTISMLIAFARIASAATPPMAAGMFDVVSSSTHPSAAAELAWLEGGLASGFVSTRPEGEGVVSAPHFQVLYGRMRVEPTAPFQTDSIVDRLDRTTLRLGTGMALSQLGLASPNPGSFDLALGAAFERTDLESYWYALDGGRQWLDVSVAARMGGWRAAVVLAEALEISSDSGFEGDRHLEVDLGRDHGDGLSWGCGFDLPLEKDGTAGLRLGLSRVFRDALVFQGEMATAYADETNAETGKREFVRRSLDLRLGTRLRFRPWGIDEGDSWMRRIVDPKILPGPDGFLLRGWEVGLSAGWDVVSKSAHPAFEIARSF